MAPGGESGVLVYLRPSRSSLCLPRLFRGFASSESKGVQQETPEQQQLRKEAMEAALQCAARRGALDVVKLVLYEESGQASGL